VQENILHRFPHDCPVEGELGIYPVVNILQIIAFSSVFGLKDGQKVDKETFIDITTENFGINTED
jgi:hypothetical protein